MIIGTGMLARAMPDLPGVVIHAAGVSNSQCDDESEYQRDIGRLTHTLSTSEGLLVYFSTVGDSPGRYLEHKRTCEALVRHRESFLIIRLPVVAGRSPNPHTLLNYLHARIARGECFDLWTRATRHVIDVLTIARFVRTSAMQAHQRSTREAPASGPYGIREIVAAFEKHLGKQAVYREVHKGEPSQAINGGADELLSMIQRNYW